MPYPSQAIVGQGTKISAIITNTVSVSFVSSTKKITRAAGSWLTDGVAVGMKVSTTDVTNSGPFTVTVVTALDITVAESITDEAAASKVITSRAIIGEIQTFGGPGGSANVIDVTNLDSIAKEKRIGLQDEGQFKLDMNFVADDPGQVYLRNKRTANAAANFEFIFTDAGALTATFTGYVLEFSISGGVDDRVRASATIEITGAVVYTT